MWLRDSILGITAIAICSFLELSGRSGYASEPRPLPLIFDTDIGNDVDDVIALAMIHALESRGECKLLAVTITKDQEDCAPLADAVNTFYHRGDVPIGVCRSGVSPEPGKYSEMARVRDGDRFRYPHDLTSGKDAPDAVDVLRRTLASAADSSVVVVQVGISTNLANLLDSPADANSPLHGRELVKKKVRLASIMAGEFGSGDARKGAEFNIVNDIPAAQRLVAGWPTPIVFSGFEVGLAIRYPAESIEQDYAYVPHHPVAEAYWLYNPPPHCRPSWDPTSVLYAVRPERGYFALSPPGQVQVADNGTTTFEEADNGPHRYLIASPKQCIRAREAIAQLASQPPSALSVDCKNDTAR